MYVSKFFTCPEIDQRLKQGYFDDFVSAGFIGTIEEFWAFVLSIKDRPTSEAVQESLSKLETTLQDLIKGVQEKLSAKDEELDTKIDQSVSDLEDKLDAQKVTKVSQLENDANYQTEEQVKAFISALVNGADESLDTLLELAEALGNDPNFAATVTEKLGQLKKAIEDETLRATEKENELKEALNTETTKREEGDANVLKLTEQHIDRIANALQESFSSLDEKITSLNGQFLTLQNAFHTLSQEVDTKVSEAKKEASDANDALKEELKEQITQETEALDEKIDAEITRATKAEEATDARVTELSKTHIEDLAKVKEQITQNATNLQKEISDRSAGDLAIQQKVVEEASARAEADANLQDRIAQETLSRVEGDADLQSKLTQEISERKTADTELSSQITLEKTARETADSNLSRDLEQLETKHDNELSTITQNLDAEIARAKTAENGKVDKVEGKGLSSNDFTDALLAKLNGLQDQANYITKVSELINDSGFQTKEEVAAEIQKIIGSAPEVLDTLQEIAEALGNDPNFAGTIMNRLAAITTQLNEEIQNRKDADDNLKLELLAEIKKTTDSLGNSYAVLEERLNSLKTASETADTLLDNKITALSNTLNDKVELFLEKVTELSDKYTEKVTELNAKVNQFTTEIMARINAQDDLIQGNSANIQRNLELIQALTGQITDIKDTANKNLNTLLQAIREEADARKAADDVLTTKVDANTQKIEQTAQSLEELEQYIKDNPTSIKGSSTIEAVVRENLEGKPETILGVIITENDPILSKETTGLKTTLGVKKTETESGLTYELTGVGGNPLPGVTPIEVPEANPFTEPEARDMYDEIYGDEFDPEAASNLVGMTPVDATEIFNEVYS